MKNVYKRPQLTVVRLESGSSVMLTKSTAEVSSTGKKGIYSAISFSQLK